MLELRGIGIAGKKATGMAHFYENMIGHYHRMKRIVPEREKERLYDVLEVAKKEINQIIQGASDDQDAMDIFETHLMFLIDEEIITYIINLIDQGYDLLSAFLRTKDDMNSHFLNMTQEIFRSKVCDIEDVFDRLIKIESGINDSVQYPHHPFILVCDDILPSIIYQVPKENLQGILVRFGSNCSHGAIIARARNIPVVIRLKNKIDKIRPHQKVLMNGESGIVFLLDE